MIPQKLSDLILLNDKSVQPARHSVATGETKFEDGIIWYEFIDEQEVFYAGLDAEDNIAIEEM